MCNVFDRYFYFRSTVISEECIQRYILSGLSFTVWKLSKYGGFSGPYFPVFGLNTEITPYISVCSPNTGKYGPEKLPYLNTFHAVIISGGHFQLLFRLLCFFETSTWRHSFVQKNWLICQINLSQFDPFLERPLYYYKIAVVAIHSFRFIVFFQNESFSKEVSFFQRNYQLW